VQEEDTYVQEDETYVQEDDTYVQQEDENYVQEEDTYVQEDETYVQEDDTYVQEDENYVQEDENYVEEDENYVQEDETYHQEQYTQSQSFTEEETQTDKSYYNENRSLETAASSLKISASSASIKPKRFEDYASASLASASQEEPKRFEEYSLASASQDEQPKRFEEYSLASASQEEPYAYDASKEQKESWDEESRSYHRHTDGDEESRSYHRHTDDDEEAPRERQSEDCSVYSNRDRESPRFCREEESLASERSNLRNSFFDEDDTTLHDNDFHEPSPTRDFCQELDHHLVREVTQEEGHSQQDPSVYSYELERQPAAHTPKSYQSTSTNTTTSSSSNNPKSFSSKSYESNPIKSPQASPRYYRNHATQPYILHNLHSNEPEPEPIVNSDDELPTPSSRYSEYSPTSREQPDDWTRAKKFPLKSPGNYSTRSNPDRAPSPSWGVHSDVTQSAVLSSSSVWSEADLKTKNTRRALILQMAKARMKQSSGNRVAPSVASPDAASEMEKSVKERKMERAEVLDFSGDLD